MTFFIIRVTSHLQVLQQHGGVRGIGGREVREGVMRVGGGCDGVGGLSHLQVLQQHGVKSQTDVRHQRCRVLRNVAVVISLQRNAPDRH